MINIDPIKTYCKCLSENEKEIWTFGLFDESGKGGIVPGFGTFFCPINDLSEKLSTVAVPYSLHVTLNQTSLTGRRTEHIQSARVLCVDLDRKVGKREIQMLTAEYSPDMVVQSSPGKFHLYWRVTPTVKLESWKRYQAGLAHKLGGDLSLSGVTHMIRVPGFERLCKDGSRFIPDIVRLVAEPRYRTDAGIRNDWPWIIEEGEKGFIALKEQRSALRKALGRRSSEIIKDKSVSVGGRNDALYSIVNEWVFKNRIDDLDVALGFALEVNESFSDPLEECEAICAGRSAFSHGCEGWQRQAKDMVVLLPELPEQGHNGHEKPPPPEPLINKPAKERGIRRMEELPPDIAAAAAGMINQIWMTQPKTATKLIVQSLATGQFDRLIDWFVRKWELVGRMGVIGPAIFVRGESAWGTEVWRARELSKEQFMSVFAKVGSSIVMRALRSDKYKGLVKRPPKYSALGKASEWAWRSFLCRAAGVRQPPGLIAYQNGVLDLASGEFKEDLLTPKRYSHAIDASFLPGAAIRLDECPMFGRFLEDWFPGDGATKELVLRWFGYCMTTEFNKQKFMFMWGPTGSGKGSLCAILGGILGCEHCTSMNYGALAGSGAGAGRFQEADMHNRLLITVEEAEGTVGEHAGRMDRLKKVVGGERVMIERKWGHPFQDWIVGKIVLQSNVAPVYQDKGGAIRARMIPVGFEHSFRDKPSEKPPAQLVFEAGEADKIATIAGQTWAGVCGERLPFVVAGSRALEIGREAIESEMDILGSTLEKFLIKDSQGAVSSAALSELVRLACEDRGIERPLGTLEREIKIAMNEKKYVRYSRRVSTAGGRTQQRGWRGVVLDREAVLKSFDYFPEICEQYSNMGREIGIEPAGFTDKIQCFK